jgi:uncharacterized protein (DUF433 family)
MMGRPVIQGTRITVELILHKLAEGASEAELLEAYPHLAPEDIWAAIAYGAASVAHEEVVLLSDVSSTLRNARTESMPDAVLGCTSVPSIR